MSNLAAALIKESQKLVVISKKMLIVQVKMLKFIAS